MINQQAIGSYAFILGVIVAVLAGVATAAAVGYPGIQYVALVLVILGLVVGFLNISDKEVRAFLLAGIALIAVGIPGTALLEIPFIGTYLAGILINVSVFAAPAVLVVALKEFYILSKTPIV